LPRRARIDWPQLLHGAGFADVEMTARPEWHELYTRVYRVALELGDPGGDASLADLQLPDLQDEARHGLPVAGLKLRVMVTATAPA
jgi:hypothetical protein